MGIITAWIFAYLLNRLTQYPEVFEMVRVKYKITKEGIINESYIPTLIFWPIFLYVLIGSFVVAINPPKTKDIFDYRVSHQTKDTYTYMMKQDYLFKVLHLYMTVDVGRVLLWPFIIIPYVVSGIFKLVRPRNYIKN